MLANFANIKISAVASALPKNKLDLKALQEKFGEQTVRRIIANTGIKSVRVAKPGIRSSDLCAAAAKLLFKKLNLIPESVDAIVFVSQTPDRIAPATSGMLQDRLGLSNHIVAFDINYGCSGYLYGLLQAAILIQSGVCKKVLICAGDVISPLLHDDDRNLRMLLGDAGTATLVEEGNDNWSAVINTDGSGADYLTATRTLPHQPLSNNVNDLLNGYYHMDGAKVMNFAMEVVPEIVDELLIAKGWRKEEVGTYALHQPNEFMLRYLQKKLNVPKYAVPVAVENVGNTGPASIPLLLSMMGNDLKVRNQMEKVILCGFGVGLSWGGFGLNLSETQFFLPIEV
jgi:3-oxoacyl-[acyl-carrier-protein] synthase-3